MLSLLYLSIQRIWLWGALQLGRTGFTYNNPAQIHATEAQIIAQQSKPKEARLPPQVPRAVLELGVLYGYLNQWLGGYGPQPEATMHQLERPVERHIQRLNSLAASLGIGPVKRLPMRTAADFTQLTQRLETDEAGLAQRVEEATSPRLRHLFLLGVHLGTEQAALMSAYRVPPIPAAKLIGRHATLAGVSEGIWRPLTQLPAGKEREAASAYMAAIKALESSIVPVK